MTIKPKNSSDVTRVDDFLKTSGDGILKIGRSAASVRAWCNVFSSKSGCQPNVMLAVDNGDVSFGPHYGIKSDMTYLETECLLATSPVR